MGKQICTLSENKGFCKGIQICLRTLYILYVCAFRKFLRTPCRTIFGFLSCQKKVLHWLQNWIKILLPFVSDIWYTITLWQWLLEKLQIWIRLSQPPNKLWRQNNVTICNVKYNTLHKINVTPTLGWENCWKLSMTVGHDPTRINNLH